MVTKMYETRKEYKRKGEIDYHLPEWVRILRDYFRIDYGKNSLAKPATKKNRKESVEDRLR